MKRITLFGITSLLCLVIFSCKDDDETVTEVKPLANITYEQKAEGILFKWENPNENLSYVEILFKNDAVQADYQRIIVQGAKTEQLVSGLPDENDREYIFTAYRGTQASSPTKVIAHGAEPAFKQLASTLSVSIKMSGVNVNWDKNVAGEFYINLNIDTIKSKPDYEIVIREDGPASRFVPISGVKTARLYLTVSDVNRNVSKPFIYPYVGLESGWLDRSIWKVVDFSSQEEVQEQSVGGKVNSRAVAVLDGDVTTFWHSRWSSDVPGKYPHYITFDLGRKVILTKAQLYRRVKKTDLKKIEIQGGPGKDGPWEKIVEYELKTNDNAQTISFPDTTVYQYQYIRLFCTEGNSVHASLAEFSLYGQDIEED